jgi:hypothetical protein
MQLQQALSDERERLRRVVVTEVGCCVSATGSQIDDPIDEVGHWADYGLAFDYLEDTGLHDTRRGRHADCCTTTRPVWWGRSHRGTPRSISMSQRRFRR